MYDPAPRRGPSTTTEWLVSGIFLAIILGLLAAEIGTDYTAFKLSALLFVLFWIPLLVLHEAGHAVAAFLMGWQVSQVVIGMGKIIGRFRLGTAAIEIRLFAIEGFVRCVPRRLSLPHLESALIYLAGPGVEIMLAVGILFFVGAERFFTLTDDYWLICWQSLALAAASQGILNLIPFAISSREGNMASDGLGIILSLLRPKSYYAAMIASTYNTADQDWQTQDPADWWKREK